MKLDITDTIILTIGIIATLIAVINAAIWLRVLIQLYREDTGCDLPATDLDGSDAQGSAYGAKGSAYGAKGSAYGAKGSAYGAKGGSQ